MNNNEIRRIKIDLTKKSGSIGHCMSQHRDEILSVKSSDEAHGLLSKLFESEGIDTPKSRQILFRLQSGMKPDRTLFYLNDIIMKAAGLGVI